MSFKTVTSSNAGAKVTNSEILFRDVQRASLMSSFMGNSPASAIYKMRDINKMSGYAMTFNNIGRVDPRKYRLDQQSIRDAAQKLENYSDTVTLHEYNLPVSFRGGPTSIDEQTLAFDQKNPTRQQLVEAIAKLQDLLILEAICSSPTRTIYGGDATSTATLETGDKITPERLVFAAAVASGGDLATDGVSLNYNPISQIMVNGRPYHVIIVDTNVAYDWARNPEWIQAAETAMERSKDNPLFKPGDYIYNNVLIRVTDDLADKRVFRNGGAGSNVPYTKCHLLGASAVCAGFGSNVQIIEDYDKIDKVYTYNATMVCGFKKTQFNSKDWGVVEVQFARTKVTDRNL